MSEVTTEESPEQVNDSRTQLPDRVDFQVDPGSYRHWKVVCAGTVATVTMDVDPEGGLAPGYQLKLNSYDLGVDIELYDIVQRLRFEHPEVRCVVLTGADQKVFCAGANIRMLASSSHAWKVNFCKFTNETRNGIEDASGVSGQRWLAALNGTASGGGYELALACDRILLVDDRSSAVSLPELPLLAVLPGTGGLTRVVDKRHVRRDRADYFSTRAEGIGGVRAKDWGLVDGIAGRSEWDQAVADEVTRMSEGSPRPEQADGVDLVALKRSISSDSIAYPHLRADLDRQNRVARIIVSGPEGVPEDWQEATSMGSDFWPLAVARELDDLILELRTNEQEIGTWVLTTRGDPRLVLAIDQLLLDNQDNWLANEILAYLKRTLKRLDVTSRSLIALVEPGSCFAGTLLELILAADRTFHLDGVFEDTDPDAEPASITIGPVNRGAYPMGNGLSRLESRFFGRSDQLQGAHQLTGRSLLAAEAEEAGLVTFAPDDIDWEDEVRLCLEERSAFSPDALSGLEANFRFVGPETAETKIFGRLTAWQNWIFNRPNAVGDKGALRQYGSGQRAEFDRRRV